MNIAIFFLFIVFCSESNVINSSKSLSAKKEYGDNLDELIEKSVDNEIRQRIQKFGGDEVKADEAIKQKWHDRETYKNLIKKEILTQWYLSKQKAETGFIPYRQLIRKYDSIKAEKFAIAPELQFSLIDIVPSRLTLPDPNMNRRQYAEDLANEIYEKLKSGEDFAKLAKEYSHGHRKDFGGLWEMVNPDSLAAPYDAIPKVAMKMNPGEISEPIKTDTHIFIIKVEQIRQAGYEPFEKVQDKVKDELQKEKSEDQAMSQLDENINQQMERYETKAFIDYCLEKIYKDSNKDNQ